MSNHQLLNWTSVTATNQEANGTVRANDGGLVCMEIIEMDGVQTVLTGNQDSPSRDCLKHIYI